MNTAKAFQLFQLSPSDSYPHVKRVMKKSLFSYHPDRHQDKGSTIKRLLHGKLQELLEARTVITTAYKQNRYPKKSATITPMYDEWGYLKYKAADWIQKKKQLITKLTLKQFVIMASALVVFVVSLFIYHDYRVIKEYETYTRNNPQAATLITIYNTSMQHRITMPMHELSDKHYYSEMASHSFLYMYSPKQVSYRVRLSHVPMYQEKGYQLVSHHDTTYYFATQDIVLSWALGAQPMSIVLLWLLWASIVFLLIVIPTLHQMSA